MSRLRDQNLPVKAAQLPLVDTLLHLFFPERCLFCRSLLSAATVPPLCSTCAVKYFAQGTICPECEKTVPVNDDCPCSSPGLPLKGLFALARYDRPWRSLLLPLKYNGQRYLARPLGFWLGYEISRLQYCLPAAVVPIPLHRVKEKDRGYNQSALIAGHAARYLGIPCRNMLVKNRETLSQTTMSRRQRSENIRGAFSCSSTIPAGLPLLLVDDIYSTGATLKEAATVLHDRGALVYGAVIAYNPGAS